MFMEEGQFEKHPIHGLLASEKSFRTVRLFTNGLGIIINEKYL